MKTIYSSIEEPIYPYSFLQSREKTAFFDIETTGLSPNASSLYLIGLMTYDCRQKEWFLRQWFADNYQSEKEILETFLEALSNIDYLYHFNGRTFDIPYVLKKCARHALPVSSHCNQLLNDTTGKHSIDLLGIIRPLRHALMLDKCNQTSIEQWLGIKRTDTFSGGELITVYSEYMQQKLLNPPNAEKLEKVLLLHNHDDLAMMLNLCSLLTYDEYLSEDCTVRLLKDENLSTLRITSPEEQTISLSLKLPMAVPKAMHLFAPFPVTAVNKTEWDTSLCTMLSAAQLSLEADTAHITIPFYKGTLKFFLPNYKEYYYLTKEDMAVHKSVAEFVDSTVRKKATAATCYIKKEGLFLPNLTANKKKAPLANKTTEKELSLFYLQYKDKLSFCELPEDYAENTRFWKQYLAKQLPCFR